MIIRRRRVRVQIEQTTLHIASIQMGAMAPAVPPVADAGTSHLDSSDHFKPNLSPPSQEPRE
jgi:hypothetical protein